MIVASNLKTRLMRFEGPLCPLLKFNRSMSPKLGRQFLDELMHHKVHSMASILGPKH